VKLDALDHPKTLDLAARLEVELPTAIGHLELLWAFVAKKAPAGNLGKWPDGAIARACYWMGRPETFLQALRDSGFIDEVPVHRLIVHDWSEHAPRWVKAKLKTLGFGFADTTEPTVVATAEPTTVATAVKSPPSALPPLTKGSLGKGRDALRTAERADARQTAKRLPDSFELTPERQATARAEAVNPEREFARFCDHWRAASGQNARKHDWDAAWRNWCRKAAEFAPKGNGAKPVPRLRTAD